GLNEEGDGQRRHQAGAGERERQRIQGDDDDARHERRSHKGYAIADHQQGRGDAEVQLEQPAREHEQQRRDIEQHAGLAQPGQQRLATGEQHEAAHQEARPAEQEHPPDQRAGALDEPLRAELVEPGERREHRGLGHLDQHVDQLHRQRHAPGHPQAQCGRDHRQLALVWQRLEQPLRAVRAQAEVHAAAGDLNGAIDRLRSGLRQSRGPDADQVEASVIDARLRTLVYERQSMLAEMYKGRYIPPDVELPN
ncbi:hypothetical protein OSTOST_11308, partial [Ostertagia ostertagi]